jgi:hypothetical protein
MERGDTDVLAQFGIHPGALAQSIERGSITFGVVMDDKTLKITLSWSKIKETSEIGISEFVLKYMRDERGKVH